MAWRYKIYNGERITDEGTSSTKPSVHIDTHPNWIVKKNENGDVLSIEYQPPIIKIGIIRIKVWSFSIKIFLIAGSNNQAIEEVLVATINVKKRDKSILPKNL